MNPSNALAAPSSSSELTASAIRPRQRRLISGLSDDLESNTASAGSTRNASPLTSPFGSRSASPIPKKHPSRAASSHSPLRSATSNGRNTYSGSSHASRDSARGSLSGLWGNSWSALQGLASSVLGSDVEPGDKQSRRRRPLEATHTRSFTGSAQPKWGPSPSSQSLIGVGTQEERETMVRAMKRQDLLNANGHLDTDSTGKFKRRNSDERISSSAPPGEHEYRDALVYVHNVQPKDTLAGITIRFNCQAAVLRKANRMWPNDSIQTRKVIVLPVDACGVKGRPVPGPGKQEEDLLLGLGEDETETVEYNTASSSTNGWQGATAPSESLTRQRSSTVSSKNEHDPPWIHDSWVLFPNDTEPTEIARLPRRTLGYFPPARRKSITFSDATPTSSFDLPRSSITSSPRTNPRKDISTSPLPSGGRPRTTSVTAKFPLQGPGGVGTLGRNVRAPGPAQDGLNKFFAAHLPNVLPPPSQEHFTPWTPALLEQYNNGEVLALSAAASGSGAGVGFDIENMGGAIESWVRKMATKASKAITDSSAQGARMAPIPGLGAEGGNITDLIELQDDPFEIGDEERDRSSVMVSQAFESTGRPALPEGMRGRDRRSSSKGKDKKGD